MDPTVRERINTFLAQYDTLAIATVDEGQPYVTRVFFVEEPIEDSSLRLYGTFITTSRKLANLRQNPNIGIFIGPDQPTMWLEATAWARILTDEGAVNRVRTELARKSAVAAGFLAQVPIAAVELQVNWLRITNLTGQPMQTEVNFTTANSGKEEHA